MDYSKLSDAELDKLEKEYDDEVTRLNNLQLARKIQINSIYGAFASPYFRYYDLRVAEGITKSGQLAIRWVSKHLNNYINKACKTTDVDYVVYNDTDSVVGDTLVYVNGEKQTIENLYDQYTTYEKNDPVAKNYVKPVDGVTTLSVNKDTGEVEEKPIKYVMKHTVKKRMFRVTSASGNSVVVTQDHSIIVKRNGVIKEVCPSELLETDKIINITTPQNKGVSLYGIGKSKKEVGRNN
jgi:hypothetical protein